MEDKQYAEFLQWALQDFRLETERHRRRSLAHLILALAAVAHEPVPPVVNTFIENSNRHKGG